MTGMKSGMMSIGIARYRISATAIRLGMSETRRSWKRAEASDSLSRNRSFAIRFANRFSSDVCRRHQTNAAITTSARSEPPMRASVIQSHVSMPTALFYVVSCAPDRPRCAPPASDYVRNPARQQQHPETRQHRAGQDADTPQVRLAGPPAQDGDDSGEDAEPRRAARENAADGDRSAQSLRDAAGAQIR